MLEELKERIKEVLLLEELKELKERIKEVLHTPTFISYWKDDPRWVLFCRLVMWGSILSLFGLFAIGWSPIILYLNLPLYLRFPFLVVVSIFILLAIIFGTPVLVYERKSRRGWLMKELEKIPKNRIMDIAHKEKVSVKEDSEKNQIIQQLMKKLNRKVIEHHIFSDEEEKK